MSALVHLVRHAAHDELGRVLSGRSAIGLNNQGRAQARGIAAVVARRRPRAIHSSPQRRARETAQAIAEITQQEITIVTALDEIDFGDWTGAGFAALADDPAWQRWNAARGQACPPNGEAMADAVARVVTHVAACAAQDSRPIVLVSHCDPIRGVLAHYLGLPIDRMLGFDCDPASVSTVSVGDWGGRVVSINERGQ